jgi:hypothetical protein
MFREMAKVRSGMRVNDIAESKHLLWELVTHEPTVLQCFSIVEATCMAQGLFCRIDGERCGEKFQRFLDKHYIPFCRQVTHLSHFAFSLVETNLSHFAFLLSHFAFSLVKLVCLMLLFQS